jgi:hypothetical protein
MGTTVKKTVQTDNLKNLQQIIRELNNKKIKVGIFGSAGSKMLMIATVNEYGVDIVITPKMRWWLHFNGLHVKKTTTQIHIPARSFIRATINEKQDEINSFVKANLDLLFTFQITTKQFLDKVGHYLVGLTQETLTDLNSPKNHPWTVKRKKGKDNPLINTGQLRESIVFEIE